MYVIWNISSIYRFKFFEEEPTDYRKYLKDTRYKKQQHKKREFLRIMQPYIEQLRTEVNNIWIIFCSIFVCICVCLYLKQNIYFVYIDISQKWFKTVIIIKIIYMLMWFTCN